MAKKVDKKANGRWEAHPPPGLGLWRSQSSSSYPLTHTNTNAQKYKYKWKMRGLGLWPIQIQIQIQMKNGKWEAHPPPGLGLWRAQSSSSYPREIQIQMLRNTNTNGKWEGWGSDGLNHQVLVLLIIWEIQIQLQLLRNIDTYWIWEDWDCDRLNHHVLSCLPSFFEQWWKLWNRTYPITQNVKLSTVKNKSRQRMFQSYNLLFLFTIVHGNVFVVMVTINKSLREHSALSKTVHHTAVVPALWCLLTPCAPRHLWCSKQGCSKAASFISATHNSM